MLVGQFDLVPNTAAHTDDLKASAKEVRHGNIEYSHRYR